MVTLKDFSLKNNYLLLTLPDKASMFGADARDGYIIAINPPDGDLKAGAKVYLRPDNYPTVNIEGQEYILASTDDLIGVVNAS